jgi:hypothetical protein
MIARLHSPSVQFVRFALARLLMPVHRLAKQTGLRLVEIMPRVPSAMCCGT